MKASDIPDARVYEFVLEEGNFASWYKFAERISEFPEKVVHAKFAQMQNKGRIEGCRCGCSGGFRLETEKHLELASRALGKKLCFDAAGNVKVGR